MGLKRGEGGGEEYRGSGRREGEMGGKCGRRRWSERVEEGEEAEWEREPHLVSKNIIEAVCTFL